MKIIVLGAGALGAYFGARWQESGHEVINLVREGRAEQMKNNGLKLHSEMGDYEVAKPVIARSPEEIDNPDLVFLAVKGYHLHGTLDWLKSLVNKGAKVYPVLNGMEHIHILQKELGEEAVIGGHAYIIATLDEKGHVVHTSPFHDLVFGPLHSSQQAICEELALACNQANLTGILSPNVLEAMWNKYMFITAFSGITTATNQPIGMVRRYSQTFKIAERILKEMKKLANAHQINLTDEHVNKAFERLRDLAPDMTSSMHQDRRKGLPLEVEHLHGGALRLGNQVNLRMPYIETIHAMIKPYEKFQH
ncbi:ketopantoate reductase [Halobacillus karajensis]|uniref:2-dehydropantoate 2-reductase n=1 Tax=Halobacillus karajensis TaxID=195088 RepID=A0A024P6T2_9BACI|nr:ketopantoate reductase family protein [Halobacillus karajensis]CDQ20479.1 2-dehydropantoate 2-reductase [Halobacillus karajensis]CDQ24052.1 2-dehydropantoate 2-reductase [Halobacillus karajensis]CDQ27530.1 2-dehydropantoate 2-reductase [Halobacillus karajensis]SEH91102.1 ketopantoate reductase [Halobacillus karajensis]